MPTPIAIYSTLCKSAIHLLARSAIMAWFMQWVFNASTPASSCWTSCGYLLLERGSRGSWQNGGHQSCHWKVTVDSKEAMQVNHCPSLRPPCQHRIGRVVQGFKMCPQFWGCSYWSYVEGNLLEGESDAFWKEIFFNEYSEKSSSYEHFEGLCMQSSEIMASK